MKATDLISETMAKAQTLDSDQLTEFFLDMGIMSVAVLRGIHGDKYATGYLKAAIADKDPLVVTAHMKH